MEEVETLLKFIPLSKVVGKDKFDFMRDIHELWEKIKMNYQQMVLMKIILN